MVIVCINLRTQQHTTLLGSSNSKTKAAQDASRSLPADPSDATQAAN
jgi:hypothetical protein